MENLTMTRVNIPTDVGMYWIIDGCENRIIEIVRIDGVLMMKENGNLFEDDTIESVYGDWYHIPMPKNEPDPPTHEQRMKSLKFMLNHK